MPVKGPEKVETARLCVMTLLGEAASVTSTYVCSAAPKRLRTPRAAATTSDRRRLSPRRTRRRTRPARSMAKIWLCGWFVFLGFYPSPIHAGLMLAFLADL